jgi:hypothetical protein
VPANLLALADHVTPSYTRCRRQTLRLAALQSQSQSNRAVFAKLKTLLRKAAERTVEATWQRICALLQCFTPAECVNYIRNAGYASV